MTYEDIYESLDAAEPFESTLHRAVLEADGERYSVYSKNILICQLNDYDETIYFDNRYYNKATSRLQNIIWDVYDEVADAVGGDQKRNGKVYERTKGQNELEPIENSTIVRSTHSVKIKIERTL